MSEPGRPSRADQPGPRHRDIKTRSEVGVTVAAFGERSIAAQGISGIAATGDNVIIG